MEQGLPNIKDLEQVLEWPGGAFECKVWKIKGTQIIHHPHEPAVQYTDGDWAWYWMDKKHSWHGPAIKCDDAFIYYIYGEELTKRDWGRDPRRLEWLRERVREI